MISVASYSFHGLFGSERMDLFGYLESVKHRYGLNTADIWNGMLKSTEESYLQKVKEGLAERELTLVNLAVDGAHIWDPDEATREQLHQNALAHLHAAAFLGAKSIRIDMGGREATLTDEQFDLIVRRYQEYADFAAENGMKVGPENHFGPSLIPAHMKKVVEAVAHPAYGILLHVGRWKADEETGDETCAPWAMHTHFDEKNLRGHLGDKIALLKKAGYEGVWGLEDGAGADEYHQVAWAVATLKRTLLHA